MPRLIQLFVVAAQSFKSAGICEVFPTCSGGSGRHQEFDPSGEQTISGGGGVNTGTSAGGGGTHRVYDRLNPSDYSVNVGGSGGR